MPHSINIDPGSDTRRRLLLAAPHAFGQRDFDAVSTREIVEASGVNMSSISYHFGGKRGLYLATAEFLADSMRDGLQVELERIRAEMEHADSQQCRYLLGELVSGFVGNLLTAEYGEEAPGFIFREQRQPTKAFEVLYTKVFRPLHRTMAALVAGARGLSAESDEAQVVAHALLGQAIGFRSARTTMLRHLGRPVYSDADLQRINNLIAAMTVAAVDYPSVGDEI